MKAPRTRLKLFRFAFSLGTAVTAVPASAGPPYLTDDPVPTDVGHWEIYAFTAGEGHRFSVDGDTGLDLNYGPVNGVQLTATLPVSFSHDPAEGWRSGTGDVELGIKYRIISNEKTGFSAAIFPRAILPTASHAGGEKTRLLLPLWIGKDIAGGTAVFGGGGYELNPGSGNHDFWHAAVAVTHDVSKTVSVGAEVAWQQPDLVGGTDQSRAGVGAVVKLTEHYSLLFSGGPTWVDHQTAYHFYAALGANF